MVTVDEMAAAWMTGYLTMGSLAYLIISFMGRDKPAAAKHYREHWTTFDEGDRYA